MAGVSARVLAQIVLVVIFGAIPGAGRLDARRDRSLPTPGRINTCDDAFRDGPLSLRLRERRGAILRPNVVALTVKCRRIVQPEKPAFEQILEGEHGWVESDTDRFGMTRLAVMRVLVCRILKPTTGVPDVSVDDPRHSAQNVLDAPKTTTREHRYLHV